MTRLALIVVAAGCAFDRADLPAAGDGGAGVADAFVPGAADADPGAACRAVAVAASGAHTCALTEANQVWCWGDNTEGQIGVNGSAQCVTLQPCNPTPVLVGGLADAFAIGVGDRHTCAMTLAGTACWGDNTLGELGDGTIENAFEPRVIRRARARSRRRAARTTCARSRRTAWSFARGTTASGSSATARPSRCPPNLSSSARPSRRSPPATSTPAAFATTATSTAGD